MGIDILIRHGDIVTMGSERKVIYDGAIAIDDGKIIEVGSDDALSRQEYRAETIIDAKFHAVLPGLIDTHGHAGHGLIKTMAENSDGWNELVSQFYMRNTSLDFWRIEGKLAALERIRYGTTTGVSFLGGGAGSFRVDKPEFALEYANSLKSIGLRGLIGIGPSGRFMPYTPQEYSETDDQSPITLDFSDQMKNVRHILHSLNSEGSTQKACVAINTIASKSQTTDDEEFRLTKEQSDVIREVTSESGTGLLAHGVGGTLNRADKLGLLGPNVSLAHCGGLTSEDQKIIAKTKTSVVHCPRARSIIKYRCPVPELLSQGVLVSIGTDGNSPDRSFNLFEDMRVALRLHRTYAGDSHILSPGKVLEMVTVDAARVIGLDEELGSIEPGKRADVILVDLKRPHLVPVIRMLVQRLVYEANGCDIDTVIIDGKMKLHENKFVGVNEQRILEEAEALASKVIERAGYDKYLETPEMFWGALKY